MKMLHSSMGLVKRARESAARPARGPPGNRLAPTCPSDIGVTIVIRIGTLPNFNGTARRQMGIVAVCSWFASGEMGSAGRNAEVAPLSSNQ